MRYNYEENPALSLAIYGEVYNCKGHKLYDYCTLYRKGDKGLAVIQQRFDPKTKRTWWSEIDPWLVDPIRLTKGFDIYFEKHAWRPLVDDVYPTVTVRQIMWALRMKPLKREPWEMYFNKKEV